MLIRISVGVGLALSLVLVLTLDTWLLGTGFPIPLIATGVLMGLAIMAWRELFHMFSGSCDAIGVRTSVITAASLLVLAIVDVAIKTEIPAPVYVLALVSAVFVPEIVRPNMDTAGLRVAIRFFGAIYLLPLVFLVKVGAEFSPTALGAMILCAKCSDIGGFFAGKSIGGPKLAPAVSPKKTISGFVGGWVLATIAVIAAGDYLSPHATLAGQLGLGAAFAVFGHIGDLSESVLKRSLGVKDSGKTVGEVGGALDLLDSLVLAGPVGYFFLRYVFDPNPAVDFFYAPF